MARPIILCVEGEEPDLRNRFPEHEIVPIDSKRKGLSALSSAARDGSHVAIVTRDGPTVVGSDWSLALELLLERARLRRRIQETNDHLSLVSGAGVELAESFDIQQILARTHDAASRILGRRPVEIVYTGCESIHALPCWYPRDAGEGRLSEAERQRLLERVRSLAGHETHDASTLQSLVSAALQTAGRGVLPLAHREGLYGLLLFALPGDVPADRLELASVLTLQAATALRNIHLAQERIHFERLSAVGRMVGSIVHDFRSPLTALRGYAGMLGELDTTAEERRDYSAALKEECNRLEHMVDELLELSRGRRTAVDRKSLRLAPFVEEFAESVRRRLAEGVTVDLESTFDGEIRVDRKRLERALWNVVTNALQAMSGRGVLSIRSRARGKALVLEVADTGCGIPTEIRHRIFEPFFSHGKSEGIGLGMATALRVAEEHSGDIEVESEPGRGTTIRFLLPLEAPEPAMEPVGANAAPTEG